MLNESLVSLTHSPWLSAVRRALAQEGYRYGDDLDLVWDKISGTIALIKWRRLGIDGPRLNEFDIVERLPGPPDWAHEPRTKNRMLPPRVDAFGHLFKPQIEHIKHGLARIKDEQYEREAGVIESQQERDSIAEFYRKRRRDNAARIFRTMPFMGAREAKNYGIER